MSKFDSIEISLFDVLSGACNGTQMVGYFDQSLPVSVRVGQTVDIVGKAGNPKSISGGYVHTTPTLLSSGERAELALDEYEALSSVLEGFVILREKSNVS